MKFTLIVLFFCTLFTFSGRSQNILWEQVYTNNQEIGSFASATDVIPTADNGLMMAAIEIYPTALGHYFVRLIQTDEVGEVVYDTLVKPYEGIYFLWEEAHAIIQSQTGDFIVAGGTSHNTFLERDFLFMKVPSDLETDTIFKKNYRILEDNVAKAIIPYQNSGYILAGSARDHEKSYCAILQTNFEGDSLFSRLLFPNEESSAINDAVLGQSVNPGIIATGVLNNDILLFETNTAGDTLWSQTYDFTEEDVGMSISLTNDHHIAIGGAVKEGYSRRPILIKTDARGNLIWQMSPDIGLGVVSDVLATADGGFLIGGSFYSLYFDGSNDPGYLMKVDANGNEEWRIELDSMNYGQAAAIAQLEDGSIVAAGSQINGVTLTKLGNINATAEPGQQNLGIKLFPNPATTSITFESNDPFPENTILKIFNEVGQLIQSKEIPAQVNSFPISLKHWPSGPYFFVLKSDGQVYARGKFLRK